MNSTQQQTFVQDEADFFYRMADCIGDEVMVIRRDGRIVFANDAAVRALGYAKEDLANRHVTDFFRWGRSLRQWQKTYFAELKKRKRPISYIVERTVKTGKIQAVDMSAVHMSYQSEEYVLVVIRNITDQLAIEEKLRESVNLYRLLSEQAADAILMLDPYGVILYANRAAGRMFGVPALKAVGTPFQNYIDRDCASTVDECFRRVRHGQLTTCDELNIVSPAGKMIPAECTASPICREGKVCQIHAVIRNISRRREMEFSIRESTKMKALQNFIAGTIKEIQHPLKGVVDHSHGLVEKYKDRYFEYIGYKEFKDIMQTLETMRDQVKYCFDTTNRLLDINRRRVKLKDICCDVNVIIRDVLESLKPSIEVSDIKFRLRLARGIPAAAIGSLELNQVMTNIITNAMQAVPRGGEIHLRTLYQKTQGRVCIECRDDGVGIPDDVLPRIFEPFFTTKPRGLEKSSGLGLAIVYSIIKEFCGDIVVKSKLRHGTLVQAFFPIYKKRVK